jgi:hypothetical protein
MRRTAVVYRTYACPSCEARCDFGPKHFQCLEWSSDIGIRVFLWSGRSVDAGFPFWRLKWCRNAILGSNYVLGAGINVHLDSHAANTAARLKLRILLWLEYVMLLTVTERSLFF